MPNTYNLSDAITCASGVGPTTAQQLKEYGIHSLLDLLLVLPLRYEDRSKLYTADQLKFLEEKTLISIEARVRTVGRFKRSGRMMYSATLADETGSCKALWFNAAHVLHSLKKDAVYMFSGQYDPKYKTLAQATFEPLRQEQTHTGRIVPLYSSSLPLKQGSYRRILKAVCDNLQKDTGDLVQGLVGDMGGAANRGEGGAKTQGAPALPSFAQALATLHFPDSQEVIAPARERLALEEFLALMQHAQQLKNEWNALTSAVIVPQNSLGASGKEKAGSTPEEVFELVPDSIPFELTTDQHTSLAEIMQDLAKEQPMNRLLVGDVGSGKTVVAGCAARAVLESNHAAALIAPTKVLAQQHANTLRALFPDITISLLTSETRAGKNAKKIAAAAVTVAAPTLYVGTHSIIGQLDSIKPALIIYDEQHRFGVAHRSASLDLAYAPHILTMTATPIPRSLMLTIFAHLQISTIQTIPSNRKQTKTWLVPQHKQDNAYEWIAQQLREHQQQALIVCPFIDPSDHDAFDTVAAASDEYKTLKSVFAQHNLDTALLHGRQKKQQQQDTIAQLYDGTIDVLVTTPIVEVGIDLPKASIIVIQSAERFGLASLHQLRGRVGRAGQQGYCLLMTSTKSPGENSKQRLDTFCTTTNGRALAELDLQQRGSGELFGTQQSGFSQLRFGSWTDTQLIAAAQRCYPQLPSDWQPLIPMRVSDDSVLAN